jgi:hypothetical protein
VSPTGLEPMPLTSEGSNDSVLSSIFFSKSLSCGGGGGFTFLLLQLFIGPFLYVFAISLYLFHLLSDIGEGGRAYEPLNGLLDEKS